MQKFAGKNASIRGPVRHNDHARLGADSRACPSLEWSQRESTNPYMVGENIKDPSYDAPLIECTLVAMQVGRIRKGSRTMNNDAPGSQ